MLDLDFNLNEFCGMTDEELVSLAAADKSACEALVLRYTKVIFIKSEIFATPDTDRDDLRQEGLMALLKAVSTYRADKGARFSTYADVCISNQMRSFRARAGKGNAVCESLDEVPENSLSEEETPESILINKEFFSELWYAVENILSESERQTFTLVMRGVSYRETAEKLGITEKSVDNAMQRARRKIRGYLSGLSD